MVRDLVQLPSKDQLRLPLHWRQYFLLPLFAWSSETKMTVEASDQTATQRERECVCVIIMPLDA